MIGGYILVDSTFRNELLNMQGKYWWLEELLYSEEFPQYNIATYEYFKSISEKGKPVYLVNYKTASKILASPIFLTITVDSSENAVYLYPSNYSNIVSGSIGYVFRKNGTAESIPTE